MLITTIRWRTEIMRGANEQFYLWIQADALVFEDFSFATTVIVYYFYSGSLFADNRPKTLS